MTSSKLIQSSYSIFLHQLVTHMSAEVPEHNCEVPKQYPPIFACLGLALGGGPSPGCFFPKTLFL